METRRVRQASGELLKQIIMLSISATILFPIFWMVSTSLKPSGAEFAFPPQWMPKPVMWSNYLEVFHSLPFARFVFNSVLVAGLSMPIGQVLTGSLVAFGFAQVRFPGRDALFLVCLTSLMLPEAVLLVPTFLLFRYLGWIDSFKPLIVPAWFGGRALFIFLARQFFRSLPERHPLVGGTRRS